MFTGLFAIRFARMRSRLRSFVGVAILGFLTAACAATPPQIFTGANAADANAAVAPTGYRSVLAGYASQRPVGPSPWLERNRQVTPAPEKGGQK